MSMTGGLLAGEISSIAGNRTDYKRSYNAVIVAGDETIQAISVTRLDIGSDFESGYRDEITITLLLPLGTVMNKIGPYQDDLTIRLKETIPNTYDFQETEYRAFLREDIPNEIEGSFDPVFRDNEKSNQAGNINVSFALTLPIIEYIDAITTGTVLRQVPPFSVLKVLFDQHISAINLTMDEGILDITMVEPSNFEPRVQIIIPHGTKLIHLPDLMQDKMGGVYSTGMGFYISRRSIHFWPLYDVERTEEIKHRLHIYMPVSSHSTMIDNTYKKEGDVISILASGRPKIIDDSLGASYNEGDSVRYVDGNAAFSALGEVEDGVITANRADRNIETTVTSTQKAVNTVSGNSSKITSNIYAEMSRKARIDGIYLIVEWRYSNHYLIKPGMITTVFMNNNSDVREIPAIVCGVYSKYELENDGITNDILLSSATIKLFIKREDWKMREFVDSGQQRSIATSN